MGSFNQVRQEKTGTNRRKNPRRGNYFGGELIRRAEVEVRVGKLKNGKVAGGDEITREMTKGGGMIGW